MENLNIKSVRGQAKVVGTLLCICGSLIFTFWKGYLFKGLVERPLLSIYSTELKHGSENWIKGSALILISQIVWCSWLILQVIKSLISNYISIQWIKLCVQHVLVVYLAHRLWSLESTLLHCHWRPWYAFSHHCNLPLLLCFSQEIKLHGDLIQMCNF